MHKLITNKKEEYYKYEYNPKKIIDKFNNLEETFDLVKRKNCCNCISLNLHFQFEDQLIFNSIPGIYKTIDNVSQNLPEFLIRLYVDNRIFKKIKTFDKIFNSRNVEVYIYYPKKEKFHRLSHFSVFYDSEVNICALRNCESPVTNLDCHNLRIFMESSGIFYLLPYSKMMHSPYLDDFKKSDKFFEFNNNPYELKPGGFAIKLRVKIEKYYEVLDDMIDKIKNVPKVNEQVKVLPNTLQDLMLLNFFKDQVCIPFTSEEYYDKQQLFILNEMTNHFEITNFYVNSLNVNLILELLKQNKIIKESVKIKSIDKKRNLCMNLNGSTNICVNQGTLYWIDKVLKRKNIITDRMFDVNYISSSSSILSLAFTNYENIFVYDDFEGKGMFEEKFYESIEF